VNLRTVTRGDAALAFAALLLLISSFLPYYTASSALCSASGGPCSENAWSTGGITLLSSVFLLGIIGAALVLAGRLSGADPKVAGIQVSHWGTVLSIAALWSSLWGLFSGNGSIGIGAGAFLGFLGALIGAAAAVATPLVPALAAPLVPAQGEPTGYPQGQPGAYFHGQPVQQGQPGQPFGAPQGGHPGQTGGYGYPAAGAPQPEQQQSSGYGYGYPQQEQPGQQGRPFGGPAAAQAATPEPPAAAEPLPTPEDAAPPQRDRATALLKAVTPQPAPESENKAETEPATAEPAAKPAAAAEPKTAGTAAEAAPAFAPFWFAVPAARTLAPEQGQGGAPVGELVPGTWYLAIAQSGDALLTQTQEGKRGLLTDVSGIQRG
jgi:hypothetical protein